MTPVRLEEFNEALLKAGAPTFNCGDNANESILKTLIWLLGKEAERKEHAKELDESV